VHEKREEGGGGGGHSRRDADPIQDQRNVYRERGGGDNKPSCGHRDKGKVSRGGTCLPGTMHGVVLTVRGGKRKIPVPPKQRHQRKARRRNQNREEEAERDDEKEEMNYFSKEGSRSRKKMRKNCRFIYQ